MEAKIHPDPTILVIFGAGGDLVWRKLLPALYNLWLDNWLPERFAIHGLDRVPMTDDAFRERMRQGIDQFSRQGKADPARWQEFAARLSYATADFLDAASYTKLAERIAAIEKSWPKPGDRLFYLAISPVLFERVATHLCEAKLLPDAKHHRLVVEKPFGRDYASAVALNKKLTSMLDESQIFRIDHYLGKETVQNILAFRFANSIFEPIWNRRYIDHVQITVAEEVGVEHRGGYYDQSGVLRDMIQNHLFRVLGLLAMEPPVSFDDNEIRNKNVDVLRAIRPIPRDAIADFAARGQYGPGTINGRQMTAYRSEPGVNPQSITETYAAVKIMIDNWRWQDVPFYLRSGKAMANRIAEVMVQFRPVPHRSFPPSAVETLQPNRLIIMIQPEEGMKLNFQAKQPGPTMHLGPINMHFTYQEVFKKPSPDGYETLLLDALLRDATLFMRADQVEIAWSIVMPILETWAAQNPGDFPNYAAGSWGPAAADALLARDGRAWLMPTEV